MSFLLGSAFFGVLIGLPTFILTLFGIVWMCVSAFSRNAGEDGQPTHAQWASRITLGIIAIILLASISVVFMFGHV